MITFLRGLVAKSFKNQLLFGSFLMLLGTTVGNFFQFLFNLFMSRNLSVVDYGILASLISFIMLPSLLSNAIFPTVVSFAATYFAKNQLSLVKSLFMKVAKISYGVGIVIFIVVFVFSSQIAHFFQITSNVLIILAGLNVLIGFTMIINYAMLQAKLEFRFMSFVNFFSSLLKLIFGAGLVLVGYGVPGAMIGMFIAGVASYGISFVPLRSVFLKPHSENPIKYKELLTFGGPAALIFFSLTSFVTIDILLVKHFLSPFEAGLYAGLSLIGRVIFFLTAPVNSVILPLITQQKTLKKSSKQTVYLAILIVAGVSIALFSLYSLMPEFIIRFFLKNDEYLLVAKYLSMFSLFIVLYSVVFLMSNIFLAIKRTEIYIPLSIGAVFQLLLISFFHKTFYQIIGISLSIIAILLLYLLIYYWHISHEKIESKKAKK